MSLFTNGDLRSNEVPAEVQRIAEALSRRHGEVHVARESSGLHLYMASPRVLEEEGRVELEKRHLAVNVDKFFRMGKWRGIGQDNDRCAQCMKTSQPYRMAALLSWPTLQERGILDAPISHVKIHNTKRNLVDDGRGNMVPHGPGQCVPINRLPPAHPAVEYLKARKYNLDVLWAQFRCSFCYEEEPMDSSTGVFYKPLSAGFRDTPQNRIIFFGDISGVQQIWQARVIDKVEDRNGVVIKSYLHPYYNNFVPCEYKDSQSGKFRPLQEIQNDKFRWEISKYKTATGASRQECVIGLDAAVAWNKAMGIKVPVCVGGEGPLDAGRWGPPAVAIIGKHLSEAQAALIMKHFKRFIYVRDNDIAGKKGQESVMRQFVGKDMDLECLETPDGKDPGDMSDEAAWDMIKPHIFR